MDNEIKSLLFHIEEELEGTKSYLELEYDEDSMSFSLDARENDENKIRLVYDFAFDKTTYSVDGEETDEEYDTAIVSIDNGNDYIVVTNSHLDIPFLYAPGINYIVVPDYDFLPEHIATINKFSVCLTFIKNFELENPSLSTTIVQLDRDTFTTPVTVSASLFEMALASEKVEKNGVTAINNYVHSVFKKVSNADVNKSQFGDLKPKVETDQKEIKTSVITVPSEVKETVKHTTVAIIIADLTVESKYQLRVSEDASAIKDLVSAYKDAETVPAIEVVDTGNKFIVVDGFHRCAAATEAGLNSIECVVTKGTQREAFRISLGANANNKALKRTNADKRKSVHTALSDDELKELSNREIAAICKVSHSIVNRIRAELLESGNVSTPNTSGSIEEIDTKESTTVIAAPKALPKNISGNVSTPKNLSKSYTKTLSFKGASVTVKLTAVTDENRLNELLADLNGVVESYILMEETS